MLDRYDAQLVLGTFPLCALVNSSENLGVKERAMAAARKIVLEGEVARRKLARLGNNQGHLSGRSVGQVARLTELSTRVSYGTSELISKCDEIFLPFRCTEGGTHLCG